MSLHQSNTDFVGLVVVSHGFSTPNEWAAGLDKLADLSDDILDGFYGVSEEQARADRELFDRILAESEHH